MIISRTPFRVSLFGGGSDYPKWYRTHGGAVVGFAIDKYCYISIRYLPPFFTHRNRIAYSIIETTQSIQEIQHPSVRAVLMEKNIENIEIHHDADLPARSGLGSSSSFTVGMLNAVAALQGKMVTNHYLAKEAIRIEQQVIKEEVGSQDQIWAAYGGFNRIDFLQDDTFKIQPIILPNERKKELIGYFLLYFTGLSRFANEIAKKKVENIDKKIHHIEQMVSHVDEAINIITSETRPLTDIGHLLHESWMLKRDLADTITTPDIDEMYQQARRAGALGGKILGAGGGGFMLLFVEPEKQEAVKKTLQAFIRVSIDIDHTGSKIVIYEPNGLEARY